VATHRFQAEVDRLLHLVIHSLYGKKEIFLRELLSNASDALDKLRFRSLTDEAILAGDPNLEIRIVPDETAGTLTIEDTGIGMTEAELVENLGTIAHSGSKKFLETIAKEGATRPELIGQFGVGFYSGFLVAERVEVISRAAGTTEAHRWVSTGEGEFLVEPSAREGRGTSIVLHLRPDQREYLAEWRLRALVRHWSDFVGHPIKLKTGKGELETVNQAGALWRRPKNEITAEQYDELYRHLTHDHEAPLARTHFTVEGAQSFTALLYVPREPEPDLFGTADRKRGLRLFVRRVFVLEDATELLPEWLRFVRGVVDSDDLPLNVSREILQDSSATRTIRKQLVRKVLDLLEEVAKERPDDYAKFVRAFGPTLKTGIATDSEHRARIASLARYESSATGEGELVGLAEYVARMKEGQGAIYWILGESRRAIERSPHVEALVARGYEVLLLVDPVDEFAIETLGTFEGKPFVSAMREGLELDEGGSSAREAREAALRPLLDRIGRVLAGRVESVRISTRLQGSPACLAIAKHAHHPYVERLLRERGRAPAKASRIFEIDPDHPLVVALAALPEEQAERFADLVETLHDQALLTEGSAIDDPQGFARRLTGLLTGLAAGR
jgi:molecular chaperone HtpG